MATELQLELKLPVEIVLGSMTTFTIWRAICYLEGDRSLHNEAAGQPGSGRSAAGCPRRRGYARGALGTGIAALPGNHGAGVGLAGGGGGGAQLGEPAVAGLQAAHRTSANSTGRGRGVRTPLQAGHSTSHTAYRTSWPILLSAPHTLLPHTHKASRSGRVLQSHGSPCPRTQMTSRTGNNKRSKGDPTRTQAPLHMLSLPLTRPDSRQPRLEEEPVPEILRPDHLGVVHHFALVGRDLQGGQHVVHPGQAGGSTRWHAVEFPLQDVEAGPPCHMGALEQVRQRQLRGLPSKSYPTVGLTAPREPSRVHSASAVITDHLDRWKACYAGSLSGPVPCCLR